VALPINVEIALTHIRTRKRSTLVAALSVTIGIALYVFSSTLMGGFGIYSRGEMFKTTPHLKVFREDEISQPLFAPADPAQLVVVSNPRLTNLSKKIIDPYRLLDVIAKQPYIVQVAPQVNVDIFYNNGKSQLNGLGSGIQVLAADAMFNISSTMLAGDLAGLASNLDAIVIGNEVAEKMNVGLDDNLTITSSRGATKVMRVIGIFSTGNKVTDGSKSYMHLASAQQLAKESPNFITDIYANTTNPDSAVYFAAKLQPFTEYRVEAWQISNASMLAGDGIRLIMNQSVSLAIMLMAAFGIYNIMNMTISQKLNDIAILKATGFQGRDIVKIFLVEALIMGLLGTVLGLLLGTALIMILSQVYVGEPIGYFPIYYKAHIYVLGTVFGFLTALGAGYWPALKAAKVDPVAIFRK
jgi:lipoprotein-releasing system permease protein